MQPVSYVNNLDRIGIGYYTCNNVWKHIKTLKFIILYKSINGITDEFEITFFLSDIFYTLPTNFTPDMLHTKPI